MKEILKQFQLHLSNTLRLSENTSSSYLLDLEDFFDFLIQHKKDYTLASLQDFRSFLLYRSTERNLTLSSNARAISSLKCFYKFLEVKHNVKNSNISKIKSPKLPKTLPKALKIEEVMHLLDITDNEIFKAITILIYGTGLRISEALSLKRKDISKSTKFIKIKGKGGVERIIPLLENVKDVLLSYIENSKIPLLSEYPLFISDKRDKNQMPKSITPREVQRFFQNQRGLKNLPKFTTPHAMRHSFATHIIESGGDIRNMQSLLGHKSASTTQKYIKVDEKFLKESYNKFHQNNL